MLAENLFLTCTLYSTCTHSAFLPYGMCSFYHQELGTLSVKNPTWVVNTCLCLQYVITEIKEMSSDLNFLQVHFSCAWKMQKWEYTWKSQFENFIPRKPNSAQFNPLTSKVCLFILLSSGYTFLCKLVRRIWFYLISLSIIVTFLLDNVQMFQREVTC